MEAIKLGDIKRYKTSEGEFIGTPLVIEGERIRFVDSGGEIRHIWKENIIKVSIVKLGAEVREVINEYADNYRKYVQIEHDLFNLARKRDEAQAELNKKNKDIRKVQGLSSYYGVANSVRGELIKNKSLTRKGYAVTCSQDYTKETGAEYVISIYTERKVEPSLMGGFIRTSRTAGVLMDTKTEGYKKLVRKMEQKLYKFKEMKNGKGYKVSERKSWVEGNHELLYVHAVIISFRTYYINEEVMTEVVKIVQA